MIDWGLWLLPVRHKCILIYGSHLGDLNQELWPTWRCTSGLSNKDLFIPPMERLAQGRGDPPLKLWTLPSTPVSSWNLLNQFLFAKLTEKVKTFCSRLRSRTSLSYPRGSHVLGLMKIPFQGRNSHLLLWQASFLLFVSDSTIPWRAAHHASLPPISRSLLKLISIELVMSSNHLILRHPFLLLSSIFPSIRNFSSEWALCIRCLPWHLLSGSQMLAAKIPSVPQLAVCPLTIWGTWSFWRDGHLEEQSSWPIAHLTPPSIGFSRWEYWSGLPFPSPGDLPDPGIKLGSPALQADSFIIWATREAQKEAKLWQNKGNAEPLTPIGSQSQHQS